MTKLGEQWFSQVDFDTPQGPNAFDYKQASKFVDDYETQASKLFSTYKDTTIPEAIQNCITEGRCMLSFSIPYFVVDTDAYQEFKAWAANQNLTTNVIGRSKEIEDDVIMNVTPMR